MAKDTDRLGKLERIKWLIISGRYKIDAERLAEKMLGVITGALAPSQ